MNGVATADRELARALAVDAEAPHQLEAELGAITHELATARYQSPLRYPGAKTWLAPTIAEILRGAKRTDAVSGIDLLVEPFAGGGSVSLRLVGLGIVDRILLADADEMVSAFWKSAAADADELLTRIEAEWTEFVVKGGSCAVERWDHWRSLSIRARVPARERRLLLATKCLFLNRTTFSGILHGRAGPIGGRSQASDYSIGCRWNQRALEQRIRFIEELYDLGRLVDVWHKDWRETLDGVPEHFPQLIPTKVVAYVDPPYLEKSPHLYRRSFDPNGGYAPDDDASAGASYSKIHVALSNYLRTKSQFRWLLSYDNDELLSRDKNLYADSRMTPSEEDKLLLGLREWRISKRLIATRYSAAGRVGKRSAKEMLMTTLPPASLRHIEELRKIG